jgi:hypothetical protein
MKGYTVSFPFILLVFYPLFPRTAEPWVPVTDPYRTLGLFKLRLGKLRSLSPQNKSTGKGGGWIITTASEKFVLSDEDPCDYLIITHSTFPFSMSPPSNPSQTDSLEM